MILLYGQERADGWIAQPAPQDRVSLWGVAFLYLYGAICWILFLVSICGFMSKAGRVTAGLAGGFCSLRFGDGCWPAHRDDFLFGCLAFRQAGK